MHIKCGKFVVKINPYIETTRRKSANDIVVAFDEKFDQHERIIDSLDFMSECRHIDEIKYNFDDVLYVLSHSETALERIQIIIAIIRNNFSIR